MKAEVRQIRTAADGVPSNTNEYETPRDLFARLDFEFSFDVDAFAKDANALCPVHFSDLPGQSAFDHEWVYEANPDGLPQGSHPRPLSVFMNPPYSSNVLGRAVSRGCAQSRKHGILVVALVPPSISTRWWHDIVMRFASEVRLMRGRISFEFRGKPIKGNRGDSCIVVFRPGVHGPVFSSMDAIL